MTDIFESPDHGNTVYVREAGEKDRALYKKMVSDYWSNLEVERWRKIVKAGKENPGLQEVLDRAIIIYELSKKDES
jgi:hypothetical protein